MSTNDREIEHQNDNLNPDVRNVNMYLFNPKSYCTIGTWNVQTMYIMAKPTQVIKEMGICKLGLLGINKHRWTGSGGMSSKSETGESYTSIYSGQQDTHHRGVAILMNKQSVSTLLEWETINESLIKERFNSKYCKLTIKQCYAPTYESEDGAKEDWYDQLRQL